MKLVLLLQNKRLTVCQARRGRVGDTIKFNDTSHGIEDFKQFLQQHRHTEFVVVLDLEGEQLHLQKIPRMSRRDQKAILQHHQRKLYGDTPYASGIVDKRNDHTEARLGVTLIGLPADIDSCVWLTQLADAGAVVRSFHWMSLLVFPLADAAGIASTLTVFIVRLGLGDDRIIAFGGRRPLICRRLAEQTTAASQVDESGTMLAGQLMQTFAYLESQLDSEGLQVPNEVSMSVLAIGGLTPVERKAIDQQLGAMGINPIQSVSLSSLVNGSATEGSAATSSATDSVAEVIALSVLRRKSTAYSLVLRGTRFLERRLRHSIYACCIGLVMGAAVASASARYVESDLSRLEFLATQVEEQAMQLRQVHSHPAWSEQYAIEAIKESVAHVNAIEVANQSTPFHFLAALSEHLTRHPTIELQSIKWSGVNAEKINEVRARADRKNSSAVNLPGSRSYHAVLTGSVELTPDGYSPAMSQFRSFVASIRESALALSPGTVVTVVNLPFGESRSTVSVAGFSRGEFTLEVSSSRAVP